MFNDLFLDDAVTEVETLDAELGESLVHVNGWNADGDPVVTSEEIMTNPARHGVDVDHLLDRGL